MSRNIVITLLSLIIPLISCGQILKINRSDLSSDRSNYYIGKITFGYDLNNRSGTQEEQILFQRLLGKVDLSYVGNRHALVIVNQIKYQTVTDGPFISTGYTHLRSILERKRTLSYETFLQLQYDNGRALSLRFLSGGGVRWQILQSDRSDLHMGIGMMYENEKWEHPERGEIRKDLIKTTNYVGFSYKLSDNAALQIVSYFQTGYDDGSDIFRSRFSGTLEVDIDITEKLTFVTDINSIYENHPVIPLRKLIYSVSNGIRFRF